MLEKSLGIFFVQKRCVLALVGLGASLLLLEACAAEPNDGGAGWGGQGTGGLAGLGTGGANGLPMMGGTGGTLGGAGGAPGGTGGAPGTAGVSGGTGGMTGTGGTAMIGTGGMTGTGGTAMTGTGGSGMVDPKCGATAHCTTANGMMVCVDNTTGMPPTCTSGGTECTTALPGSACAMLPAGGMGCVLGCGMATADQCAAGLTCQNPFGMGAFCADSGGLPPTCTTATAATDCAMYPGTVCTTVSVLTGCFKSCTM